MNKEIRKELMDLRQSVVRECKRLIEADDDVSIVKAIQLKIRGIQQGIKTVESINVLYANMEQESLLASIAPRDDGESDLDEYESIQ